MVNILGLGQPPSGGALAAMDNLADFYFRMFVQHHRTRQKFSGRESDADWLRVLSDHSGSTTRAAAGWKYLGGGHVTATESAIHIGYSRAQMELTSRRFVQPTPDEQIPFFTEVNRIRLRDGIEPGMAHLHYDQDQYIAAVAGTRPKEALDAAALLTANAVAGIAAGFVLPHQAGESANPDVSPLLEARRLVGDELKQAGSGLSRRALERWERAVEFGLAHGTQDLQFIDEISISTIAAPLAEVWDSLPSSSRKTALLELEGIVKAEPTPFD